jgi:hypothetical protein
MCHLVRQQEHLCTYDPTHVPSILRRRLYMQLSHSHICRIKKLYNSGCNKTTYNCNNGFFFFLGKLGNNNVFMCGTMKQSMCSSNLSLSSWQ